MEVGDGVFSLSGNGGRTLLGRGVGLLCVLLALHPSIQLSWLSICTGTEDFTWEYRDWTLTPLSLVGIMLSGRLNWAQTRQNAGENT